MELGKMLFFDPRLSASNLISCSTCHNIGLGGVTSRRPPLGISLSPGEDAKIVAFLNTLTGAQPHVTYPIMPPNSATTPKPLLQ